MESFCFRDLSSGAFLSLAQPLFSRLIKTVSCPSISSTDQQPSDLVHLQFLICLLNTDPDLGRCRIRIHGVIFLDNFRNIKIYKPSSTTPYKGRSGSSNIKFPYLGQLSSLDPVLVPDLVNLLNRIRITADRSPAFTSDNFT